MSINNKISAGFSLIAQEPVTSGIEDVLYVLNRSEWVITYDTQNPLLITGIAAATGVTAPKIYKFTGTNNSFNTTSKMALTAVGPRYTEAIDFNIAGLSTVVKTQMQSLAYGRQFVISINNYKATDSAIELFGAVNGMKLMDSERNAADETNEGGYKVQFANPEKLREPYPPRAVMIPPTSGTATYASTLAALEALVSTT